MFVRLEDLIDGDALVLCLLLGFLQFYVFVVREMLDIFRMIIRFVSLGFGGGVELFFVMKEELWITEMVE